MKFRNLILRSICNYTNCGQRELDLLWVIAMFLGTTTPKATYDYLDKFRLMASEGRSIDFICNRALDLVEIENGRG
jgi:hypothetical protein